MLKPPSLVKAFLFFLAFVALLFLSELIFISQNKSHFLIRFYLNRAQTAAQNSNIENALDYIEKAGKIKIAGRAKQYPELIPSKYSPSFDLLKNNPQLERAYLNYISNLDPKHLFGREDDEAARLFYTLGLLAYINTEPDMVIPLFQSAIYLEPELSHYHVELANFYLELGNKEKSQSSLEYCLKFKNPIQHCQDYTDNNFSKNMSEEAGFLEKELEKYYDSS